MTCRTAPPLRSSLVRPWYGRSEALIGDSQFGRRKCECLDALRSRTDERRATEVAIAVSALNRMLEIGRPEYVRIVWPRMHDGKTAPTDRIRAPQSLSAGNLGSRGRRNTSLL